MKIKKLALLGATLSMFTLTPLAHSIEPNPAQTDVPPEIVQGESRQVLLTATSSFYAASADSTICKVAFDIQEDQADVSITGVTPGSCTVYYFNDNVLYGKDLFTVVGESPSEEFSLVPCYVFYNSQYVNHYYTSDEQVKEDLMGVHSDWGYVYQGIAYYVYTKNN